MRLLALTLLVLPLAVHAAPTVVDSAWCVVASKATAAGLLRASNDPGLLAAGRTALYREALNYYEAAALHARFGPGGSLAEYVEGYQLASPSRQYQVAQQCLSRADSTIASLSSDDQMQLTAAALGLLKVEEANEKNPSSR